MCKVHIFRIKGVRFLKEVLRVTAVSSKNLKGQIEKNLFNHRRWIERAVDAGAQFVGFPECSLTGYDLRPELAIGLDSEPVRRLGHLARKHHIWVAAGLIEKKDSKRYNTQVLFGPGGFVGAARKVNLAGSEPEFFSRGGDLPVFDIGICKVGIAICADATYYEVPRILALKGAEMIFMPHAGYLKNTPHSWLSWRKARWPFFASDIRAFFVGCNNAGLFEKPEPNEENYRFASGALILDDCGRVVAESKIRINREVMVTADLDFDCLRKERSSSSVYKEFQANLFYGSILST